MHQSYTFSSKNRSFYKFPITFDENSVVESAFPPSIENKVSLEKLHQINNIVLELEKASVNLGSSITGEDRDTTPLSEQKR